MTAGGPRSEGSWGAVSLLATLARIYDDLSSLGKFGVRLVGTLLASAIGSSGAIYLSWPPALFKPLSPWLASLCVFAIFYSVFSTLLVGAVAAILWKESRDFRRFRKAGDEFGIVSVRNAETDAALFEGYMLLLERVVAVVDSSKALHSRFSDILRRHIIGLFGSTRVKIGKNVISTLTTVATILKAQTACDFKVALYVPTQRGREIGLRRVACSDGSGSVWPEWAPITTDSIAEQVLRPRPGAHVFASNNIFRERDASRFSGELIEDAKGLIVVSVQKFGENMQLTPEPAALIYAKCTVGRSNAERSAASVVELASRLALMLFRLDFIRRQERSLAA
jgi:hypothetical protein